MAESLLTKITQRLRRAIPGYTAAAFERMLRYPWPGNIRELENVIERACVLAAGALIDVDDLPAELNRNDLPAFASPKVLPLREMEREYILGVLQRNGGNRSLTAEQLRIDRKSLRRKLKDYVAA